MRREGEISILGIAVRILLVFLFVFLLIWLFPMPNLNPVYSGIFNDNVQTMKDAAKSYFTVDRMPLEEGDSVKLTLRQMIDKKLLLPFVDSNDNECNADTSFVEVTKTEEEYLMKIYLSCTDNTDYIIEHIGCYEICKDCQTTTTTEIPTTTVKNVINRKTTTKKKTTTTTKKKTAIEYQFKKTSTSEVIDRYECDKGYVLDGDSCIKYEEEDTKNPIISCPSGYTYNAKNQNCTKEITETLTETPTCKTSGYTFNKSTGNCEKGSTTTSTETPTCKTSGYTFNKSTGKCEKKSTTTKILTETPTCKESGYTYNKNNGKCEKKSTTTRALARSSYYSSSWYGPSNAISSSYKVVSKSYCSATCSVCYLVTYTYCPSGYTYNSASNNCTGTSTSYGTVTCKTSGYTYNSSTKNCEKKSTTTTTLTETPTCKTSGYTYNSSTKNCEKKSTTTLTEAPTCKTSGYTYNSSSKNCQKTIIETLTEKATLSCDDSSYELKGKVCYREKSVLEIQKATEIYKSVTVTEYKWSTSKTLEGWTATGKTRTVTISA